MRCLTTPLPGWTKGLPVRERARASMPLLLGKTCAREARIVSIAEALVRRPATETPVVKPAGSALIRHVEQPLLARVHF